MVVVIGGGVVPICNVESSDQMVTAMLIAMVSCYLSFGRSCPGCSKQHDAERFRVNADVGGHAIWLLVCLLCRCNTICKCVVSSM